MVMAHSNHYHLVAVAVAVAAFLAAGEASGLGFKLHHRSSSVVRRWAEARGHPLLGVQWPAHGSPEYYSELSRHDRALFSRRGLAGADGGLLSFAAGNATYRINSLGFLYYAEVSLGTPSKTFLVALDTGSDLFWVPCDCKQCAPLDGNSTDLRPYSPRESTTSKQVTCDNALCDRPNACGTTNGSCPYTVRYVSANTSSSGALVEDVLHLTREGPGGAAGQALQAPVVFGCGQVQTGALLEGGSPDGLFGLGMDKVSVPSVLASSGLVATDSFSMCFSADGVGRINFGDAGSPGKQAETPFIVRSIHPTYNVSFTSVNVGSESTPVEFTAVMDSGTSFTYLNEPEYTALGANFNSQIRERRANFSASSGPLPFEYCYALSRGQTEVSLPTVSLTTDSGRAVFPVLRPIIPIFGQSSNRAVGYCLAILKNDISVNIIGQNFMTGLKVVFDRQRNVLGWQEFNCYKSEATAAEAPDAAPAPTTTIKPRENDGNNRYPGAVPVPPRSTSSSAILRHGLPSLPLVLIPLLVAAALYSN